MAKRTEGFSGRQLAKLVLAYQAAVFGSGATRWLKRKAKVIGAEALTWLGGDRLAVQAGPSRGVASGLSVVAKWLKTDLNGPKRIHKAIRCNQMQKGLGFVESIGSRFKNTLIA